MPNSNLIGIGYDPILGSPVCYTGDCQMDGFKHSVFNLEYTSWKPGACTNLTVPAYTQLLCLPIAAINAHTEELSSISQLRQSTFNAISTSATVYGWGKLEGLFASYGYSRQTTYLAETLIEKGQSIFHTTADITFAKLTMFEPMMQLSDSFRFVIEHMPCCSYDNDTKDYITSYIFDYFGFSFVSEMLLGGTTQEIITIDSERLTELKTRGLQTQHCVSAGYVFKLFGGITTTSNSTTTTQEEFRKNLTSTKITQLGGDPALVSGPLANWIDTVPNNPSMMKFKIKYISDLITSHRFPNDTNIATKLSLITQALNDYMKGLKLKGCPRNCSGPFRGTCKWGDLNIPYCVCKSMYTGVDCSGNTPLDVPRGVSCGFVFNGNGQIACDGHHPLRSCPDGYSTLCFNDNLFKAGQVCTCYKLQTDKTKSKHGTICGIHKYCGGKHILNEGCPHGYRLEKNAVLCYKDDADIDDASGTACGYASPFISCGNNSAQLCPRGYTPTRRTNGAVYYCSKT
ncbi:unnamed protein product [Adineta ricciae]|uniref:MACPF domain-containing protein n=1 Tax=Adineta ricciae TaxID=249248 RepID=A0A815KPF1_ADIRI|nr:unnamed protein product [Adineta ricciae]